jgi:hypothetical protein
MKSVVPSGPPTLFAGSSKEAPQRTAGREPSLPSPVIVRMKDLHLPGNEFPSGRIAPATKAKVSQRRASRSNGRT